MVTRCRWHKDETGFRWLVPGCWQRAVYGDDAKCQCPKPEKKAKVCTACGNTIKDDTQ
ncbi:MAG: hypothetical protein ACWA49_03515 [Ruegeria sp.]